MPWGKEEKIEKVEEKSAGNVSATSSMPYSTSNKYSRIYTFYGEKGSGKTWNAYALIQEGETAFVLSFDEQSEIVRRESFPDKNITVYDVMIKPRWDLQRTSFGLEPMESVDNCRYNAQKLLELLYNMKEQYDYIIIDGLTVMERLGESLMRSKHSISFIDNFSNLNWWKERNAFMNAILSEAKKHSKKGVIYTVYATTKRIKDKNGVELTSYDVPNYQEDAMMMTTAVMKVESYTDVEVENKRRKETRKFRLIVESSKVNSIPTGAIFDTTGLKTFNFIK